MSAPIATTLGALAVAEPALRRLAEVKLPFALAHRLAKLITAVGEETKHFTEQRNALVKEYGTSNGGGPDDVVVLPSSPGWPAFVAKVEELAAVEVELARAPLELTRAGDLAISAADLLALGNLVVLEEAPATTTVPA